MTKYASSGLQVSKVLSASDWGTETSAVRDATLTGTGSQFFRSFLSRLTAANALSVIYEQCESIRLNKNPKLTPNQLEVVNVLSALYDLDAVRLVCAMELGRSMEIVELTAWLSSKNPDLLTRVMLLYKKATTVNYTGTYNEGSES